MPINDDQFSQWAAAVESYRRRGRRVKGALAPWEEMQAFDLPIATPFSLVSATGPQQVCVAKPNRVAILFSTSTANAVQLSPVAEANPANGISMSGSTLPLVITQAIHGILCQVEWFAMCTINAQLYVIEVVLRDWGIKP